MRVHLRQFITFMTNDYHKTRCSGLLNCSMLHVKFWELFWGLGKWQRERGKKNFQVVFLWIIVNRPPLILFFSNWPLRYWGYSSDIHAWRGSILQIFKGSIRFASFLLAIRGQVLNPCPRIFFVLGVSSGIRSLKDFCLSSLCSSFNV